MTYPKCPECGLKFKDNTFLTAHLNKEHPGWDKPKEVLRKGWVTPSGFIDFAHPVSYEHACEVAHTLASN